jgi:putative NADH-flavin reductase
MKILLFGSSGMIGQRILAEALRRGHQVTCVVRDAAGAGTNGNPRKIAGDIFDVDSVTHAAKGHDVLISAYGPGQENPQRIVDAMRSLVAAVQRAGTIRLVAVGAGSLEVSPGVRLVDTPAIPDQWKGLALAHAEALDVLRNSDIDWTSMCPAAYIEPGQRTGHFRIGTDQLVTNEKGESKISAEDYAAAMLDEVENPQFIRRRFTAAY